ncbi:hypothetical protein G6F50_017000 [Rhizopus delemar]|uniref:Uncharacterized protein n=1 Tax=Rhizopus delemar TaxID=936053 RepID=A0A9P6XR93_9FUNG|nr:hypothetical protein G6F50_017000 [Rhizopus delemar]
MPSTTASAGTSTASRRGRDSDCASKVTMPTRSRPRHCSRLEVTTGTGTAACSTVWYLARNPQLVEISRAPCAVSATAASTKGCRKDGSASCTILRGEAPCTVTKRTGMPARE